MTKEAAFNYIVCHCFHEHNINRLKLMKFITLCDRLCKQYFINAYKDFSELLVDLSRHLLKVIETKVYKLLTFIIAQRLIGHSE